MREKDNVTKRQVDIHTLGHIDHPKEVLQTAITGYLTLDNSLSSLDEIKSNEKAITSSKRSKSLYLHKK